MQAAEKILHIIYYLPRLVNVVFERPLLFVDFFERQTVSAPRNFTLGTMTLKAKRRLLAVGLKTGNDLVFT